MEQNFTIPAFAEPITALADTPACSATELKRRFQAPSEELRQAHNALATCVEGITDATYPETVTEDMLTADLAGKINAKAEQTALDAEAAARGALETSVNAKLADTEARLTTQIAAKCRIVTGKYTGNGSTRTITLGFQPKAVLAMTYQYGNAKDRPTLANLAMPGIDAPNLKVTANGFQVSGQLNELEEYATGGNPYRYIAFQ